MLTYDGSVRLAISAIVVRARCGEATWRASVASARTAGDNGIDELGRYTEQGLSAEAEWCAGLVTTRYYPELCAMAVRAKAASWDSERWWAGGEFGLRGDSTLVLELELPEYAQGLACAMVEEWWTQPFFPEAPGDVPPKTQFLLWRDRDGAYVAVIPMVGGSLSAQLAGNGRALELRVSSGDEGRLNVDGPLLFAGAGKNPYELVRRLYRQAMQFAGRPGRLRDEKRYPECLEYLGWCTWDAFYRDVTADKVRAQLAHFNELGLPVGFLLIDDGWYPIDGQMLLSTATDRTKFPADLGPLFEEARTAHGIRYVGVWHALTGYWSGIHPDHHLRGVERENLQSTKAGRLTPAQDAGGSFAFFNSWHQVLASQRTDFVKVDGQGALHRYSRDLVPLPEATSSVQRALQASVGAHFQGQMINCMSMNQDLAWFWSMSNVTRSSPDYMIEGTEANPAQHARANAYNSLWLGQLTWCDWDMFRTDQKSAGFQAALRAMSGGPVYVSDGLRTTRPDEIWPLISSDGRVLRCDDVGTPTEDWLLRDPTKTPEAFKIRNRAGNTHVVGVFNLCDGGITVPGSVGASDLGLSSSTVLVAWSYRRRAGKKLPSGTRYQVGLSPLRCDVLTLLEPMQGFAAIGIATKMIPAKTLRGVHHHGQHTTLETTDPGELVIYAERRPLQVSIDAHPVSFNWLDNWLTIDVPTGGSLRVEIRWEQAATRWESPALRPVPDDQPLALGK
jgi:raffinose synthase